MVWNQSARRIRIESDEPNVFRLLRHRPIGRVPEGRRTGKFYILQSTIDRPQVGILPDADVNYLIVHPLRDLMIEIDARLGIQSAGLLLQQGFEVIATNTLPVGTIRVICAGNFTT